MELDAGLLAWIALSALLIVTPGPDTALIIRNALASGPRASTMSALGVAVGILAWATAATLGVGVLLERSSTAFTILKLAGAAYLCYLGLRSLLLKAPADAADSRTAPGDRGAWGQGLFSNLLNPKTGSSSSDWAPGSPSSVVDAVRRTIRNSASERSRSAGLKGRTSRAKSSWKRSGDYEDILYDTWDGIAKITINRPEVRNAFRPTTVFEMSKAFEVARDDPTIGVVILTGAGTEAFCSGGDQRIRGDDGYIDPKGTGRLNVLDLQVQIRRLPKPVIAMVAGYAIGGGHVLHVVCDLTIAADNARFGQTGPRVGSFDGGYGAGLLARIVGQKKAREIWFLCEQYDAKQALEMGLVNKVVPLASLEQETVAWCRRMLELSPLALRMLKASFNAADDGLAGIQQLAGDATLLYYMSEEAQEGRDAYVQKRKPDFSKFPKRP